MKSIFMYTEYMAHLIKFMGTPRFDKVPELKSRKSKKSYAKVHPAPDSPTTLNEKVMAYLEARRAGNDSALVSAQDNIIDHLMNHRKMNSFEKLMTPVGVNQIPLFEFSILWNDKRLLKAVISTARRLGVLSQLKRKYNDWDTPTDELDEIVRGMNQKRTRRKRS